MKKIIIISDYDEEILSILNHFRTKHVPNPCDTLSDKLIEDIYTTYKINIAIIDMKSLVSASLYRAQTNRYYEITDFINVRGVIDFEDLSK